MTESHELALRRFVQGTLDVGGLEDALQGAARFRFADTNERQIELPGPELPETIFSREDVVGALRRYLERELTARDLSDWAATIRMMDCFELARLDPDPDTVWDVLDELTSPDAWDLPSVESALLLVGRLSRD